MNIEALSADLPPADPLLERRPRVEPMLAALARHGFLAAGVPETMGGRSCHPDALRDAAHRLWVARPAAAACWRAQRLAIEALVRGRNVALREFLLPDVLRGERAATLPAAVDSAALTGTHDGRGWRLSGCLPESANLLDDAFAVVAPVRLENAAIEWIVLRGDDDGLDALPPPRLGERPWVRDCALGDVRCRGVFFREDEWLGDASLTAPLRELALSLSGTGETS